MMHGHIKQLGKDSFFYSLPHILPPFANIALIPVYTAYLSPHDFGVLAMLAVTSSIVTLAVWLNMNAGVLRFYHEYEGEERKRFLGTIAIGSLVVSAGVSVLLLAAGAAGSAAVFRSGEIHFYPFILAQIITVFFSAAAIVPAAIMKNERMASSWSMLQMGSWLIATILTVYFIVVGRDGAWGKIKAQFIVAAILFCVYWMIILKHARLSFSWSSFRNNFLFGLPILGKNASAYMYQYSDRWILERNVPLSQIGFYGFSDSFTQILKIPYLAFSDAWMPYFYREASRNETEAKNMVTGISYYWAVCSVCLCLAFCLFSRPVLMLLANISFHTPLVFTSVLILSCAYFLGSLQVFFMYVLSFRKHNMPILASTLIAAAANIGLNLFLIPRFGILAAAFTTAVSYGINLTLLYRASQKAMAISYRIVPLAGVIALAIATYSLSRMIPACGIAPEVLKNICLMGTFICCLCITGLVNISTVLMWYGKLRLFRSAKMQV